MQWLITDKKMMKKKLILHIGWHKTGTTSIQTAFHAQREQLKRHGVHYCEAFHGYMDNHSIPIYSMFCSAPEKEYHNINMGLVSRDQCEQINEQNMQELIKDVKNCSSDTYVISGEGIIMLEPAAQERMKEFFHDFFDSIIVACCVRAPASYTRSFWQQNMKHGLETIFSKDNVLQFVESCKSLCNMIDLFGKENCRIVKFEDAVASNDFVSYFVNLILPISSFTHKKQSSNQAISIEAALLLSSYNTFFPFRFSNSKQFSEIRNQDLVEILTECPGRRFDLDVQLSEDEVEEINKAMREVELASGIELYPPLVYVESSWTEKDFYFSREALDYLIQMFIGLASKSQVTAFSDLERGALMTAAVKLENSDPALAGQLIELAHRVPSEDFSARKLHELCAFRYLKETAGALEPTGEGFDPVHYLLINPDVMAIGMDPVEHFYRFGKKEGRLTSYRQPDCCDTGCE